MSACTSSRFFDSTPVTQKLEPLSGPSAATSARGCGRPTPSFTSFSISARCSPSSRNATTLSTIFGPKPRMASTCSRASSGVHASICSSVPASSASCLRRDLADLRDAEAARAAGRASAPSTAGSTRTTFCALLSPMRSSVRDRLGRRASRGPPRPSRCRASTSCSTSASPRWSTSIAKRRAK